MINAARIFCDRFRLSVIAVAVPNVAAARRSKHLQTEQDDKRCARLTSQEQILREFYASKGIDIDQPMQKVVRLGTWEDKNRDHEQWHRELEAFLKQRNASTSPTTNP